MQKKPQVPKTTPKHDTQQALSDFHDGQKWKRELLEDHADSQEIEQKSSHWQIQSWTFSDVGCPCN